MYHINNLKPKVMSNKVAKLVRVSLVTRVIVDADASESEILFKAQSKFITQIENEIYENLEEIVEDTECPYDETDSDRSDEVYELLLEEYMSSEVTSGEMIFSTELPLEFSLGDVKEGIQTFLDWDDSEETFDLEKGEKHWIVKCI